eukprot:3788110-Rhodomonas_salina.1
MTFDVAFVCRIPFPFVFNMTSRPRALIVGKEHSALGNSRAPQLMPSKKTFRPQLSCTWSVLFWMSMGLAESTAAPS